MLSILLDIEWLLSTLFDASLLTFEPPETAAPFFARELSRFGAGAWRRVRGETLSGQDPSRLGICSRFLYWTTVESHNALILLAVHRCGRAAAGAQAWLRSNYVPIFVVWVLDIGAQAAQCCV